MTVMHGVALWVAICIIIGVVLVSGFIYFLPTILAFNTGSRNKALIFWLNLLFGATGVVWVFLLIFAMMDN
jgi:hypothetical protein